MMRSGRDMMMWRGRGVMTATVRIEEPPPKASPSDLFRGSMERQYVQDARHAKARRGAGLSSMQWSACAGNQISSDSALA